MKYIPWIIIAIVLAGFAYYQHDLRRTAPVFESSGAEFVSGGVNRDGIKALTDPEYESIWAADTHLSDDGLGIMVGEGGQVYFYPLVILSWHQVINETIAGKPIVITYCPLCHASLVFERTFEDQILEFAVSGQLLDNNMVMFDRETESLWPQLKSVSELTTYPSSQITFGQFKELYPNGQVLSRDTGYDLDYTQDPYWQYYESDDIMFPLSTIDGRLPSKEMVYFDEIPSYWFCWVAAFPGTNLLTDL
ncbi:MAG: DUF3179 domain-containing (seleno)protein [Candidatus Uhrbacteria bacterium]